MIIIAYSRMLRTIWHDESRSCCSVFDNFSCWFRCKSYKWVTISDRIPEHNRSSSRLVKCILKCLHATANITDRDSPTWNNCPHTNSFTAFSLALMRRGCVPLGIESNILRANIPSSEAESVSYSCSKTTPVEWSNATCVGRTTSYEGTNTFCWVRWTISTNLYGMSPSIVHQLHGQTTS